MTRSNIIASPHRAEAVIAGVLSQIHVNCEALGRFWPQFGERLKPGYDSKWDGAAIGVMRHLRRLEALYGILDRERVPVSFMPAKSNVLSGLTLLLEAQNAVVERANAGQFDDLTPQDVLADIRRAGEHFTTARRQLVGAVRRPNVDFSA